eukprot:353932-Chlamydomonas_euryale.AAC.6
MEPQLSPAIEAQAASRIHRLGQNRPTRVVRIIAADTVEQRMLNMQAWKAEATQRQGRGGRQAAAANGGASTSAAGPSAAPANGDADADAGAPTPDSIVQEMDLGTMLRFFDM